MRRKITKIAQTTWERISTEKWLRTWMGIFAGGILVIFVIIYPLIGHALSAWKLAKHVLTTTAASLAVLGSIFQARRANEKSQHASRLAPDRAPGPEADPPTVIQRIEQIHRDDALHFRSVGTLWYIVFAGAIASVAGEIIDLFTDSG
jgi:hypothetical protein